MNPFVAVFPMGARMTSAVTIAGAVMSATNVIVEVSGRLGHTSDRDRQKDARRRNALQQLGKTVLEFTTVDVMSAPDYVLNTLRTSGVVTR